MDSNEITLNETEAKYSKYLPAIIITMMVIGVFCNVYNLMIA